jgi:hypothetical protein
VIEPVAARAKDDGHEAHERRPLGSYALLSAIFEVGAYTLVRNPKTRERLERGVPWADLVLIGIATHKVTRIVAKDRVMASVRSPFVDNVVEHGKPIERVPPHGLRRAMAELVTCQYCLAPWIASLFLASYVAAPRSTRAAASLFTCVSISDFLNRAYGRLS